MKGTFDFALHVEPPERLTVKVVGAIDEPEAIELRGSIFATLEKTRRQIQFVVMDVRELSAWTTKAWMELRQVHAGLAGTRWR